ncbi:MAG: serine/threonine-protein kinase [Candidatus Binatia bacterium]
MADLAVGERLDRFEVLGVLARSGMATLYRAADPTTGRPVVLKVPHLEYASDLVFHERFCREERIGRRLDHPGVVGVLAVDEKSRLYLAMELVEGESLRSRLAREGRLAVPEAVRLAIVIAEVLEYCHDHGVIHRDLKPENVMLLPTGGVKLLDFGIALDTTQRRIEWTGLSQTVGTPDYMAPEQIRGRPGDVRTDIYALGTLLYEMLTGRVPFVGEGAAHAKLHEAPPSPRALRPEIPPAVAQVVLQALAAEPGHRPGSALELRDALAHPASVVVRSPVVRSGLAGRLGRRGLLAVAIGAAAGYGLLLWLLARGAGR